MIQEMNSPTVKEDLKKRIYDFVSNSQEGCNANFCFHEYCKKNPDYKPLEKKVASLLAFNLVKEKKLTICDPNFIPLNESLSWIDCNLEQASEESLNSLAAFIASFKYAATSFRSDNQSESMIIDYERISRMSSQIHLLNKDKRDIYIKALNNHFVFSD